MWENADQNNFEFQHFSRSIKFVTWKWENKSLTIELVTQSNFFLFFNFELVVTQSVAFNFQLRVTNSKCNILFFDFELVTRK